MCFHYLGIGDLNQHNLAFKGNGNTSADAVHLHVDLHLHHLPVERDQGGAPNGRKGLAGLKEERGRKDQKVVRGEAQRERRGEGRQGAHQTANCHGELITVSLLSASAKVTCY